MSLALADFLIAVSDPIELKKYQEAPEELLAEFPLTPGDLAALKSSNPGWLRFQSTLEEDRLDINVGHPEAENANGFMMNNQSETSSKTTTSTTTDDEELIDEEGNPVCRVAVG
jgi:hypothetical protein